MSSKQLTKEQAINLFDSKFWEGMAYREKAKFQLFQERLCMPFSVFQEAIEKSLNRPVFTHEFGSLNIEGIRKEFLGESDPPTLEDIMNMIPAEKKNNTGHEE